MKLLCFIFLLINASFAQITSQEELKVYGYLTTWALRMDVGSSNYENCPYTAIDYDACTDYIVFNAAFDSTGGIDLANDWYWGPNTAWHQPYFQIPKRRFLNDYIHSKGKAVHLCFFCGGSEWTALINDPAKRVAMIKTIVDSVIGPTNQYDGVHFDLEPMNSSVIASDSAGLRAFFSALYDTLQKYHQWINPSKKPEVTITLLGSQGTAFFSSLEPYIDAYLHMSYNMMGNWQRISWYNCPIYKTGYEGLYYNVQCLDDYTELWLSAGIPPEKLVMGCPFNYNMFKGGLTTTGEGCFAPLLELNPYPDWVLLNGNGQVVSGYSGSEMYYLLWKYILDTAFSVTVHYDSIRKAAWWGYNAPGYTNDMIAIFQDTTCIREIIQYISRKDLRGAMVWEICGAYLSENNVPDLSRHTGLARDHLLQAVKKARLESIATNVSKKSYPFIYSLGINYPNPFNPKTKITYAVGGQGHISLKIYDLLGREITTLVNEVKSPGEYTVEWNGTNSAGQQVASGVYFYQLKTSNGFINTRKMMFLK